LSKARLSNLLSNFVILKLYLPIVRRVSKRICNEFAPDVFAGGGPAAALSEIWMTKVF
jgi:hypothetical protein